MHTLNLRPAWSLDRACTRFAIAILGVLAASQLYASQANASWEVEGDYCSADDGARSWTPAEKRQTRDRIQRACEAVGGSPAYCTYWDAVVIRESWGGVASAVHTKGADADGRPEYGLGPLGLSVRWHRDKWPGEDEDPAFCTPEAAFVVGHAIARSAVTKWGAQDYVGLQAIYGGGARRICWETGLPSWFGSVPGLRWLLEWLPTKTECDLVTLPRHARSICGRMRSLGVSCYKRLTAADLGEPVPLASRRSWVRGLISE